MSVFLVPDYASLPPTLILSNLTAAKLHELVIFRKGNSGKPRLFQLEGYDHLRGFIFPTRTTAIYMGWVANMGKAKFYINLREMPNHQTLYLKYLSKELILTTAGNIFSMDKESSSTGVIKRCPLTDLCKKIRDHFLNLHRKKEEWENTTTHQFNFSEFSEGKCVIYFNYLN